MYTSVLVFSLAKTGKQLSFFISYIMWLLYTFVYDIHIVCSIEYEQTQADHISLNTPLAKCR